MSATLHLPDGTTRYLAHVKTGTVRRRRDRELYRAPYGTAWRTAGTGKRLPELVTIRVEVWAGADYGEVTYAGETVTYDGEPVWARKAMTAGTLEAIAPILDGIIADCELAERVDTPLGSWLLDGLQSAVPQPIAAGYRLDITWLAGGPRMLTGAYGYGAYGAGAFGGS